MNHHRSSKLYLYHEDDHLRNKRRAQTSYFFSLRITVGIQKKKTNKCIKNIPVRASERTGLVVGSPTPITTLIYVYHHQAASNVLFVFVAFKK